MRNPFRKNTADYSAGYYFFPQETEEQRHVAVNSAMSGMISLSESLFLLDRDNSMLRNKIREINHE